ncbi:uncharacterized protein EAF02_000274 [Botrytis sinoallii]|uniref:uncharacterized protein n=1 Tax=Botrytis sinoallii TaxID=1463999 RepID=UPI0018FFC111|nr:uncharacterized protein EAF02_000274 [Botrytis sinoallii]KAF7892736.1 hypothetical protein EAF02_000274 [Botrytis sinoallii]
MSAKEVTTPSCQATETFHNHCGHIITTFTHHSDLCVRNQDSRPTTSDSAISNASSQLRRSASSAFKGMGQTLGKLTRRLTLRSSQQQQAQTTSHEFTFTSRVSCPQVLFQPLFQPYPCPPCAKVMGMGPGDLNKIFAGPEEELWQQRKKILNRRRMNGLRRWENGNVGLEFRGKMEIHK